MSAITCWKAEDSSLSSLAAQSIPEIINWARTREIGSVPRVVASGRRLKLRSLPLAVLTRRVNPDQLLNHLWPVAVYRLLACGGDLKHLALDYSPDLFKIPVVSEEEDAAFPTPQLRDLAVADE